MAKKRKKVAKKTTSKASAKTSAPAPITEPEVVQPLHSLREQIEDVFDRYFHQWPDLWSRRGRWGDFDHDFGLRGFDSAPTLDMSETDKGYEISAEMPGMGEEDIDVTVADNVLTIEGEKRQEREEKKKDYHLKERRYGKVHRALRLPQDVDANKINAKFDKGVLSVELPRKGGNKKKGRKISIKKG